jgi:AcrR family transcriptional regulator
VTPQETQPLSTEAILDTAEDVLRRFGPAKASVVDVARALKVSHGSVYRHFASKAELRDAVTQRWLQRISAPLDEVVSRGGTASTRLHDWLELLSSTKQAMATDDPELFQTFHELTMASREVVAAHVDHLADQLARIVGDGMAGGEFIPGDPIVVGRAVLHATARFHHPAMAGEWGNPDALSSELDAVYSLLLHGLLRREQASAHPNTSTPTQTTR